MHAIIVMHRILTAAASLALVAVGGSMVYAQEYIHVFKGPHPDSTYTTFRVLPIIVDDSTVAWVRRGQYEWRLDTRTLQWYTTQQGGITDPLMDHACTPLVMSDTSWLYNRNDHSLASFNPRTGKSTVVVSHPDVPYDFYTIKRHPSGVVVLFHDDFQLGIWWPSQNLVTGRPAPRGYFRYITVQDNGAVAGVSGGDYFAVDQSYDLFRSWKTLKERNPIDDPFPIQFVDEVSVFGKYLVYNWHGVRFINRFIGGEEIVLPDAWKRDAIATPDTLYGIEECALHHLTTSGELVKASLDSGCPGQPLIPLSPRKGIQLNDGRLLMESAYGSTFGITSATVRPFRIDDISYSCDTLRFRVRGENRLNTTFSFSPNADMHQLQREFFPSSVVMTFVRGGFGSGPFQLRATDGGLVDTIYCADLTPRARWAVHLRYEDVGDRVRLSVMEDTSMALVRWYRNGVYAPPSDLPVSGKSMQYYTKQDGDYHAVVMTKNWCETTTDTILVRRTSVKDIPVDDASVIRTMVVHDLLGREVLRRTLEIGEHVGPDQWGQTSGYAMVFTLAGEIADRFLLVNGERMNSVSRR